MYKVVIVDDEQRNVRKLKSCIDWKHFNCEVVATGFDAASGEEAIREHRPNIVFTEIKMPDDDALTMLAGLKAEFPHMQITVLTGHRNFEYAQRAITLGVSRFLLKPLKSDELAEALEYMTTQLDKLNLPEKTDDDEAAENAGSFIVRQAKAYIRENYASRLSLRDVADHCYVSQWHLSKLLNKHLGQTLYDLLNSVRIEKAKELLEDPSLRISEIAERVGYADAAHFSRVFKKLEGISANTYRNKNCGKG